jgi:hypothetical protein
MTFFGVAKRPGSKGKDHGYFSIVENHRLASGKTAQRGKIRQYEKKWLNLPWQKVRESAEVKLFEQEGEL